MNRFFYISLFLVLCSCQTGKIDQNILQGSWVVYSAMRQDRETTTLNGARFEFDQDRLVSNFMGDNQEFKFSLSQKEIIIQDEPIRFKVLELKDDHLVLSTNIKNTPFKISLRKAEKHMSH